MIISQTIFGVIVGITICISIALFYYFLMNRINSKENLLLKTENAKLYKIGSELERFIRDSKMVFWGLEDEDPKNKKVDGKTTVITISNNAKKHASEILSSSLGKYTKEGDNLLIDAVNFYLSMNQGLRNREIASTMFTYGKFRFSIVREKGEQEGEQIQ